MTAGGLETSPEQFLADAVAAMRRGDSRAALDSVKQAELAAPHDPHVRMQKALVYRASGALPAALAALDEALALDPYNFLALLSKGAVVERLSGERVAARIYENALKLAPADDKLPPNLLTLELTEGALMRDAQKAIDTMAMFKALGERVIYYAQHGQIGPVAIVAASDESFAQAEIFAAAAQVKRPLAIFRELHAARAWLDAQTAPPPGTPPAGPG